MHSECIAINCFFAFTETDICCFFFFFHFFLKHPGIFYSEITKYQSCKKTCVRASRPCSRNYFSICLFSSLLRQYLFTYLSLVYGLVSSREGVKLFLTLFLLVSKVVLLFLIFFKWIFYYIVQKGTTPRCKIKISFISIIFSIILCLNGLYLHNICTAGPASFLSHNLMQLKCLCGNLCKHSTFVLPDWAVLKILNLQFSVSLIMKYVFVF